MFGYSKLEKFENANIVFLKKFYIKKKSAMCHHAPLVLLKLSWLDLIRH